MDPVSHSFVDRDMFVRYLGGGIGHLEQFPPAHNDTDTIASNVEVETDDFIVVGTAADNHDGIERNGDDGNDEGDGDEDEDVDREGIDGDTDTDEEDFDEETGNVY